MWCGKGMNILQTDAFLSLSFFFPLQWGVEVVYFNWLIRITWHPREESSYTQASFKYSLILVLSLKVCQEMPDRKWMKAVLTAVEFVVDALLCCFKYINTYFQVRLTLHFVSDALEYITACLSTVQPLIYMFYGWINTSLSLSNVNCCLIQNVFVVWFSKILNIL